MPSFSISQERGPGVARRAAVSVLAALWFLASAGASAAANPPTPRVEFWVVEPNEGQSSGGHAAIRIGEWIYHVEHRGDGLIADRRTPRARFEEIYRLRGNRGIEAIPLPLEANQTEALRADLETRYFTRRSRLDALDALETEANWFATGNARGYLALEIPGLGMYVSDREQKCTPNDLSRQARLRSAIEARYSPDWIAHRRSQAQDRTRALLETRLTPSAEQEGVHRSKGHAGHGGGHRRLTEATQLWSALEILSDCRSVRGDRLVPVHEAEPIEHGPAKRAARIRTWMQIREETQDRLVDLVGSQRPDAGLAILLAWARVQALDRSIATGQLHVLDPRRPERGLDLAKSLPADWIQKHGDKTRHEWERSLRHFEFGVGPLEARFAALERGHHALAHVERGSLHAYAVWPQMKGHTVSPSASVGIHYASDEWLLPWPSTHAYSSLARAEDRARYRATRLRRMLEEKFAYRLFTQNCVTELLHVLEPFAPLTVATSSNASRRSHAEGRDHPLWSGRFVPAVAGDYLEEIFQSGARENRPPARRERLVSRPTKPLARLRESMTLTSRLYRPHAGDSSFLFFADGPVWARPAVGLANFGYGLGAAGIGLFLAPFDQGLQIRRGLQGAAMSVPELFLFQVRRGTYLGTDPFSSSLRTRTEPNR